MLAFLSLSGQAQTQMIQKAKRTYVGTLQQGQAKRDLTLYPNNAIGKSAFFEALNAGCISITLTTGQVIPANCQSTTAVSTMLSARYSYNPSTQALDVEAAPVGGAALKLKLERVDGVPLVIQSSGGQQLASNTYYFPGPLTNQGSYIQEWSFRKTDMAGSGVPAVPIRVTWQRSSDGQTASHVFQPTSATRQEILRASGNSDPPVSGTGTVGIAGAGYGNVYAANSSYQARQETSRPSGTANGREPFARSFIDNGSVRIGVNLSVGGALDYLSWGGGKNDVNGPTWGDSSPPGKMDAGRQLVWSWYFYPDGSPPEAGGEGHYTENGQSTEQIKGPGKVSIGNNPVEPGDEGHNPNYSSVLGFSNANGELYTKVRGMQWDLRNVPGQCLTEKWISHDPNAAKGFRIHARLSMQRSDPYASHYPTPRQQEGPCAYFIGDYNHFFVCYGQPYTNAPLTEYVIDNQTHTNQGVKYSTEPAIMACKANGDECIILYAPHSGRYTAGVFGQPLGGPAINAESINDNSGYISASPMLSADPNRVYDFDAALYKGTRNECRAWLYNQPRWSGLPEYRFDTNAKSRLGFTLHHAQDQREDNITSGLIVTPLTDHGTYSNGVDMKVNAPEKWTNGRAVPHLYIKAGFLSSDGDFDIVFRRAGDNTEYHRQFTVNPNGSVQVYDIDMSTNPAWNGDIVQWSIQRNGLNGYEPVPNDSWNIKWISYRNLDNL
ncbi:hypothetical protein GCM10027577_28820 [Spirosoma fluminis]